MKRIRVAGIVEMDDGFALMYRINVKPTPNTNKPYGEYYVFPGGGVETKDKNFEEAVKREILEEFGIEVEVKNQVYYKKIDNETEEYVYYCVYKSGIFGTGTGPEFSGDPKYKDRGEYIPTIVKKDNIKNIRLIPENFKEEFIEKFC